MEIKPGTNILQKSSLNKTTISHLLELRLTWSGEEVLFTGELFEWQYRRPELDGVYGVGGSSATLSATITRYGQYSYSVSFIKPNGTAGNVSLTIELYLDGNYIETVYENSQTPSAVGIFYVTEPECEEPIVECENFEPQTVDNGIIEELGPNDPWQWYNENNDPLTTNIGEPCIYKDFRGKTVFGYTTIPPSIPFNDNAVYTRFDDLEIDVCLDNRDASNQKWQFNVNNLRVPLYTSVCPTPEGWIDLGDGNDNNLLNEHLTNCSELEIVIYWLNKFWITGENSSAFPLTEKKFSFSEGTLINEEYHVNSLKKKVPEIINGVLTQLREEENIFDKDEYPCPEDIRNKRENEIIDLMIDGFEEKIDDWYNAEKENEENQSDRHSRSTFEDIRDNIISWAEQQSWYDSEDPVCKDAITINY